MFSLDFDVQEFLMEVSISSSLFQHLDVVLIQPPPDHLFQLLAANLLSDPFLLRDLQLRLEPRLHANPERAAEADGVRVAANPPVSRRSLLIDRQKRVPRRLDGKAPGAVGHGHGQKRLLRRHGLAGGEQQASLVAAQVPAVVALEAEALRAGHAARDPHLAHVVRLRRRRVTVDEVFDGHREHLALRVARQAARCVRRQHDYDRPGYVCGRFGAHPRVVLRCGFCSWLARFGRVVVGIVVDGGTFPFFAGLFVAFEHERFHHIVGDVEMLDGLREVRRVNCGD